MPTGEKAEEFPYKGVAQRIRARRELLGLSRQEVADALGVTVGAYTHYETARNEMSIPQLVKLARILRSPVGRLVGEEDLSENLVIAIDGLARMTQEQRDALESGVQAMAETMLKVRFLPFLDKAGEVVEQAGLDVSDVAREATRGPESRLSVK